MAKLSGIAPWLLGVALLGVETEPGFGQSNLDAGKSPAQIFSSTCAACHRSPRELRPTSAAYLLDHYSTGGREAAAMAGYLAAVGSDPRAVQQRRPPALGAGQAPPAEAALRAGQTAASDSANGAAMKPRRPADSIEISRLPIISGGTESASAASLSAPAASSGAVWAFEE